MTKKVFNFISENKSANTFADKTVRIYFILESKRNSNLHSFFTYICNNFSAAEIIPRITQITKFSSSCIFAK